MGVASVLSSDDPKEEFQSHSVAYGLSGQAGAAASRSAAALQAQAAQDALKFQKKTRDLIFKRQDPFLKFGTNLLPELQNILSPEGQMAYLENNPLFEASLNSVNRATTASQAARGKLGSGGTLEALRQNYFATAQPLLQNRISNLFQGVNLGQNTAVGQGAQAQQNANAMSQILGQGANAQAAGLVGAANAQQQGASNIAGLASAALSFFSDRRLKRNIRFDGMYKGFKTYVFQYLWSDNWFKGVMADEVEKTHPGAVLEIDGFKVVDYGRLLNGHAA